jgi:acetyl esterase
MVLEKSTRIARFLGDCLLVLFAMATLGCLVTRIPLLGSLGPILIASKGAWMTILSLIGAGVVFGRWRKTRKGRTAFLAMLAVFAAIGTAYVQARQIGAANSNGIEIHLARTLWSGPAHHTGAPPEFRAYGSHEGHPLSLAIYRPAAKKDRPPVPVIVYVHGGGWGGGTLLDRAPDMRWFADHGYLVFSVEYTLSSESRHTWDVAQPQIGCALIWIADHAASFGGDASHLALLGESAGGNLVLNVSSLAGAGKLPSSCPGELPRIAATVAAYPVLDAVRMYGNHDLIAGPFARLMTTHYTGGTPAQYPQRYAAVSSATHIDPGAPPTLLLPGLADHLLPPEPAYEFAERERAVGVDARVIAFPYGEHSYDQSNDSIGNQFFRGATLQFLQRHALTP